MAVLAGFFFIGSALALNPGDRVDNFRLLVDKCVACHREGGVGPWAMTRYDIVRGFAPMIREVVRTKRIAFHSGQHEVVFGIAR